MFKKKCKIIIRFDERGMPYTARLKNVNSDQVFDASVCLNKLSIKMAQTRNKRSRFANLVKSIKRMLSRNSQKRTCKRSNVRPVKVNRVTVHRISGGSQIPWSVDGNNYYVNSKSNTI